MAVLPITWNMGIDKSHSYRQFYDYPSGEDLGTVFGTKYCLKLLLKSRRQRNSRDQVMLVQFERLQNLRSSNVHGCLFIHERKTYQRYALKAFQHFFKDGEKTFAFEMAFCPPTFLSSCDAHLNINGHISIDLSKDADLKTDPKYISSCPVPEIHKSLARLSSDFRHLLDNNASSDITLKCGDTQLSAHKIILSSRSPVFKAMFQNEMKEAHSKEILIPDVTSNVLKAMLNYIYSADIEDFSEKLACDLLYAADKYELLELKEICVSYLKGIISDENVFRILEATNLHDDNLKLSTCDHIGENFKTLEYSKEWISLKKRKPQLALEVLSWIVKFGK